MSGEPLRREFISYPKSGRTWVRYALSILRQADRIRFHHDTFEFNDGSRPAPDLDLAARLERCRRADRVVYLSRDPRDILVSLYFQVTGRFKDFFNYQGSIAEFIRDDYFGARHLLQFQQQWAEICAQGLALHVRYEDCHADFTSTLQRVVHHFQLDVPDAAIVEAAKAASLNEMRQVEQSGAFSEPWLRPRNGSPKVRRGVVGGYKDYLSDRDIAYLDALFAQGST